MPTAEFDLPAGHADVPAGSAHRLPREGRPEDDVLDEVRQRFARNTFDIEKNFAITYSGIPSSISRKVDAMSAGRFFVEWADESETGTLSMEREAVGMMASLLGNPERQRLHHDRRHGVQPRLDAPRSQQRSAGRSPRSSPRSRCTSRSASAPS